MPEEKEAVGEIGYKLLDRNIDGKLTSWIIQLSDGGVEYKVGEETRPQKGCGPLMLFQDMESLRKFRPNPHPLRDIVYRCRFQRSEAECVWMAKFPSARSGTGWPRGIALAAVVILEEEVKGWTT